MTLRKCILLFALLAAMTSVSQNIPARPSIIGTGTYLGLSKPLRDLPVMSASDWKAMAQRAKKELNEGLGKRSYPYAATALPKGYDAAWQKVMGSVHNPLAPSVNIDGQSSPYFPPDCNGTAGPNHFLQTINCVYSIYTKNGTLVAGPTNINLIFGGVPGSNYNDGDPITLYDEQADRWLVCEFSVSGSIDYMMMAVSATNDPTGSYQCYSFQVAYFPDYPKFSVWRDGYYMGDNNGGSIDTYVFQRDQMLVGGTAKMIGFKDTWRPSSSDGFMCVPPVDNDGAFAPAGSPGLYIAFNDDAFGGGTDQLWIYELSVDWNTLSNSTFNRVQQIDVEPFNSNFGTNWDNISQKGTVQKVDAIPQVIMNVPQYRNFGSYQTILCCHTVKIGTTNHAGIRWYELRRTNGPWSIRQQGTYAPDSDSRWMGSIMLNGNNTISLGYSVSSTNTYPSVRYCGQSPMAYIQGNNTLDIAEDTIINGQHSQTGGNRWGDYSLMSVDPSDDKTFWFTDEYIGNGGSRKTRIASFKFIFPPAVTTMSASGVEGVAATLNGTVNPNASAATGYYIWGNSPQNLSDTTTSDTLGSGISPLPVARTLSGLSPNTVYYYRAVGVNPDGITNGDVLSFSTAQPNLSVYPPDRTVTTAAGITNFLVSSNLNWVVSSDSPWCTTTPAGSGNDTIFATFTENTSIQSRVATITVDGIWAPSVSVTVTQEGQTPQLIVTPPNRDVTADAGATDFSVVSNVGWIVSCDANWCTVTPSGIGNGIIAATYTANNDAVPRVAHISTMGSGIGPVVVTVSQAGATPTLSVSPANQNVAAPAGSVDYTVTSNTTWSAQSDSSWCTVTASGSGNGTIIANFTANPRNIARLNHISVTATSVTPVTVSLTQAKSSSGISETGDGKVMIYPNPNQGIFNIVPAEGKNVILNVEVNDMNGKLLLKKELKDQNEYQVDLSHAEAGTYNLVIKSGSYLFTRKIVIIR
ncbi:MAG: BACON domain-containing carbohydrate-binding protein [Bacteroidetes bacterium]|nr:BACON domain-containing carbohydrate-binding protein [Bacteroidota bacterium]